MVPEDSIEGRFHVSLSRSEKSSFVSDETNNEYYTSSHHSIIWKIILKRTIEKIRFRGRIRNLFLKRDSRDRCNSPSKPFLLYALNISNSSNKKTYLRFEKLSICRIILKPMKWLFKGESICYGSGNKGIKS